MKDQIITDFAALDFIIENWPEGIEDRAFRERHICEYQVLVMTLDHFEIFREHRCTEIVGNTPDDLTTLKAEDGVTVDVLVAYFARTLPKMVELVEKLKQQRGFVVLVAHKPIERR